MKNITIEVRDVSKTFPGVKSHQALKGINIQIQEGEIYGIIGMSGAGKSTLLRCLIGLERPDSGTVNVLGTDITTLKSNLLRKVRQDVGMIFQHFHLFSSRTVAENIAYAMEIYGVPKEIQEKRIDELLELVNLKGKKDVYPAKLSGGEKQRVGIARALANHPKILLCDEATSALDPKTTRSILNLLQKLNQTLKLTIVVITHQIEVIKQICTRVAVLSHGELVEEGSVTEIFTEPKHAVTKFLLHHGSEHLPELLIDGRSPARKLIRLFFDGEKAKEPVISRMIKNHDVEANILFGSLDCIQNKMIGHLVIELIGEAEAMGLALVYLKESNVKCEELNG